MSAEYALRHYIDLGIPPHVAAAIVGRFQQESGPDLNTEAVHDDGSGYGIGGWRDPQEGSGRKTNLMNWAKDNNLDPSDLDTQLDFFLHEITDGDESKVGDLLANSKTIDDATNAMIHYERPEGYDANDVTKASGYQNGLENARALLAGYTGNSELAYGPTGSDAEPDSTDQGVDADTEPDSQDDNEPQENEAPEDNKEDYQGEGKSEIRTRIGKGLDVASRILKASSQNEPLDYTPAGDNMQVAPSDEQGIPTNAYQQYTSAYKNGGVVGEMNIDDYFDSLG